MANLFCMVCDKTPCQCLSSKRRRKAARPAKVSSKPQPVQQTEPVSAIRKTARARTAPPSEETPQATPEVWARDLRRSDIDEDRDFELIEAVRALAHMVEPNDLEAFKGYLAPSDLLPPEERRAAWLNRVHRGATDGTSA